MTLPPTIAHWFLTSEEAHSESFKKFGRWSNNATLKELDNVEKLIKDYGEREITYEFTDEELE
jgi:hypothetical protein